jgi:hypothetical protein
MQVPTRWIAAPPLAGLPALVGLPALAGLPALVGFPALAGLPALGGLLALAGCSQHNSALAPLSKATLTAGVGLGELRLGQTTLGAVVQRYGVETVTQLSSDEVGLELLYEHGQLALLFLVEPDCLEALPGRNLRPAAFDLPGFLEHNACLRELKLASLSVREGSSADSSFFQGATDAGVKLGGGRDAPLAHGTPGGGSGHILAGLNPSNPREQLHFQSGICFYLKPPPDGDPKLARVQRITVFPRVE